MKDEKLYKGKYILSFYEKDDDTLAFIACNLREVCKRLRWEVNRKNMNVIQVNVYRALKRQNHQINLFKGKAYRVYLIDDTEEDIWEE